MTRKIHREEYMVSQLIWCMIWAYDSQNGSREEYKNIQILIGLLKKVLRDTQYQPKNTPIFFLTTYFGIEKYFENWFTYGKKYY